MNLCVENNSHKGAGIWKKGSMMARRLLISLGVLLGAGWTLLPAEAIAEGTEIRIRVDYTSYRTRPQPKFNRSHVNFVFTLKEDGTVQQDTRTTGRYGRQTKADAKLGKRFRVVDEKSIQRRTDFNDRVQTIIITVAGNTCRATMTNELKPGFSEWKGQSTQLGVDAYYRDWKMTNSTCTIR